MRPTLPLLVKTDFPALQRKVWETLQINLGYKCNQTCLHCHVNAGPHRTEMMDEDTVKLVLAVLQTRHIKTVDLTGGAPELNENFRALVQQARHMGAGVFERSIAGLQLLNELGYGQPGSGLTLNLVYNPQGPVLPPAQGPLEADYKRALWQHFGIRFNQLFVITNMPVQRFGSTLVSKGSV